MVSGDFTTYKVDQDTMVLVQFIA